VEEELLGYFCIVMKRHAAWLSLYEQRDTQNQSRNILEQQLVYTQMQAWGDVCLACAA